MWLLKMTRYQAYIIGNKCIFYHRQSLMLTVELQNRLYLAIQLLKPFIMYSRWLCWTSFANMDRCHMAMTPHVSTISLLSRSSLFSLFSLSSEGAPSSLPSTVLATQWQVPNVSDPWPPLPHRRSGRRSALTPKPLSPIGTVSTRSRVIAGVSLIHRLGTLPQQPSVQRQIDKRGR